MRARLLIERAGPLCTIQDLGRPGMLMYGISASGPMDQVSHALAGQLAGAGGEAGIEITRAGLGLRVKEGELRIGWAGGVFTAHLNGQILPWPGSATLRGGDRLEVTPGPSGNYGYLRFGPVLQTAPVLASQSTSTRARIGGLDGRALMAGDELTFAGEAGAPSEGFEAAGGTGPIRFIWGLHADQFPQGVRQRFIEAEFGVTAMMDRMGVRLDDVAGVFEGVSILSLVSDPVLPGDIQILGDGTPVVLMRDHQPTGGYPRIGTIISADLDRFAQIRAGESVAFTPISVEHAHGLLRSRHP